MRENPVQPAHSHSLIRIFTGCILMNNQGCKVPSSGQQRHRLDYVDWQADLSLSLYTHQKVGFLTLWLKYVWIIGYVCLWHCVLHEHSFSEKKKKIHQQCEQGLAKN